MDRYLRKPAWGLSSWGSLATALGIVLACSSNDQSFFGAPPLARGGAGSGLAGGNTGGTGDNGAADEGPGAAAGSDSGGAPDMTGTTGGTANTTGMAGEPGSGGTGGKGGKGGASATGGASAQGGGGDAAGTGGASTGGMPGAGGDAGTAGVAVGGAGASNLGGMAGLSVGGLGGDAGSGAATGGLGGMGGTVSCVPTEPADEICDGIDNDCEDGVDGPGVCPDGCVGAVYDQHRYLLCSGVGDYTFTRQEAHTWCSDDFSNATDVTLDLARVDTEAENDFLLGLIAANKEADPIWIAASDSTQISDGGEGFWVWGPHASAVLFWENGSPVNGAFSYWGKDQPDNDASGSGEDCAVFDPDLDWHWNDRACSNETSTLLCEELD